MTSLLVILIGGAEEYWPRMAQHLEGTTLKFCHTDTDAMEMSQYSSN